MLKLVGAVAATGTVLLLAACGGSSKSNADSPAVSATAGSSAATSSAAPSGSASSSGSVSAGAQQYLSITAPINTDLTAFLALPGTTPIKQVQAAATKVAGDETTLIAKLKSSQWPGGSAQTVTSLETASQAELGVYKLAAAAPTVAKVESVLKTNQAKIAARAAAAAQLRTALGLPNTSASATAKPTASSTTST